MNKKTPRHQIDFATLIETLDEHYIFYVQGADGVLTYISPSVTTVLGYSQEECLRDYKADMTDNPINAKAVEYTQRALSGEAPPPYEMECYAKNGEKRVFEVMETPVWDEHSQSYCVHGISRDITEAKRAAEKMAKNEALFREAERIAHIGSWSLDGAFGSLVWSDEVHRIFEADPGSFVPSYGAFLDFVHPADRARVEQAYRDSIDSREAYSAEYRLLMRDGRVKYVHERGENSFDGEGRFLGTTGTIQDITDHKALVAENEKKQAMLFQQSKMAQMGEMLGNIAHQWRQPLSHINSVLLDLDRAYESKKLTKEYLAKRLDKIEEFTAHMSDTIEGFRNYFDPRKKKEYFSSQEVIDDAIKLFEPELLKEMIKVSVNSRGKKEIYGYKKEFVQVLLVLLNNAKDALSENKNLNPTIEISCHDVGKRFGIEVSDNGGGIAAENLQRIFEPYYSTKEEDGRGVGLYMAKMIVENSMGGELRAESTGGCAKFTILI